MVDGVALLDAGPGQNGDHVVIGEGEGGVLVAALHHHARDSVPGAEGTKLETVCIENPTETLDHLVMCVSCKGRLYFVSLNSFLV